MKKQVTLRALTARIKRKLAKDNQKLTSFSPKQASTDGFYGIVDLTTNTITAHYIDIVALGRELGVLADYEELSDQLVVLEELAKSIDQLDRVSKEAAELDAYILKRAQQ